MRSTCDLRPNRRAQPPKTAVQTVIRRWCGGRVWRRSRWRQLRPYHILIDRFQNRYLAAWQHQFGAGQMQIPSDRLAAERALVAERAEVTLRLRILGLVVSVGRLQFGIERQRVVQFVAEVQVQRLLAVRVPRVRQRAVRVGLVFGQVANFFGVDALTVSRRERQCAVHIRRHRCVALLILCGADRFAVGWRDVAFDCVRHGAR